MTTQPQETASTSGTAAMPRFRCQSLAWLSPLEPGGRASRSTRAHMQSQPRAQRRASALGIVKRKKRERRGARRGTAQRNRAERLGVHPSSFRARPPRAPGILWWRRVMPAPYLQARAPRQPSWLTRSRRFARLDLDREHRCAFQQRWDYAS